MNTQPPEEIQNKPFFYKPFFIAPKSNVFAECAIRFDELAAEDKSSWRDYLVLLAEVSRAQDVALNALLPESTLPTRTGSKILPESDGTHIPPLFVKALQTLLAALNGKVNDVIQAALNDLAARTDDDLHPMAQRVLQDEVPENEQVYRIWLHAVLQCAWTAWATNCAMKTCQAWTNAAFAPAAVAMPLPAWC